MRFLQLSSQMRWVLRACFLFLSWAPIAYGHLIPAQKGSLNLVGEQLYMVLSVPIDAFSMLDPDGDGHLAPDELETQSEMVKALVRKGIQLGDKPQTEFLDILLSLSPRHEATGVERDQLVIMAVIRHPITSAGIPLRVTLFGRDAGEQSYQITATRPQGNGLERTQVVLTSQLNHVVIFGTPWASMSSFILLGWEHIVTGFDHLLFLVAFLVMGFSLRRWLILLSSFTLAHGCTFALASLGWVTVPSFLVEPFIALSIVLVALMHLAGFTLRLKREALLVFCCGLIHGLGFASALGANDAQGASLDAAYPIWSILGFNLGVELGQMMIAVLVFLSLWFWQWQRWLAVNLLPRGAAASALAVGGALFVYQLIRWG